MAGENMGRRLTRLMSEREITVRSAADIAGVPPSTIQSWRTGSPPRSERGFAGARKLASALGISLAYLLTGEADVVASSPLEEHYEPAQTLLDGLCIVKLVPLRPRNRK